MVVGIGAGTAVLVGAGAGVVAAIAGSVAGGLATYKIEELRQHFERRLALRAERRELLREAAVVRGVARVWADEITNYAAMLASILTNPIGPQWWPDEMHERITVDVGLEDRKAVAAALTAEQWELVRIASSGITVAESTRTFARQMGGQGPDDFGPTVAPLEIQMIQQTLNQINEAVGVLNEMSARQPTVDPHDPEL
jgi:hypothetical protein